ncbi:MAG: hypothetical protein N3A66_11040 [Planctomycetota bacterium]|nr:hypothetical protein [Planctomycetota bacterium]
MSIISISHVRRGIGILLAAILACGCGDPSTGLRAQSAERAYAEALLPPASALGPDWREIRRDIILRDADANPLASDNFLKAEKDLMRSANAPCRICAGAIYGDATSERSEANVAVTYFPEHLYALPLTEDEPLPQGFADNWLRGADGIAMGSVPAEGVENAAAEDKKAVPPPSPKAEKNSEVSAVSAPGAGEWGIDPVELLPVESAEDIARLLPPQPGNVYLAAHGLLVRITPGKDLSRERLAQAIAGIRRYLALRLHREKALRDELARRRAAQRGKVVLEAQADPAAGVYWGLLEKAMGVIYRKKY